MSYAITIREHGGPEVLQREAIEIGKPGEAEVRIRHTAIGLNFLDVYYRTGLYPAPNGLPLVTGSEGAGVIEEVGPGVTGLSVGDRVAYVVANGAYATHRLIAADRLVKLPEAVSDEMAAASMLQGMTVEYLLRRTYSVQPGDVVLCHAAAGGVGLILGQWAKHLGATVIGTAGSAEKVELARSHGYDHVIDYSREDFAARVREITDGALCHVVYDSVGKDTFEGSLDCLRKRGMFVGFGQSSGSIPPFDLGVLSRKGSLFATRPTLFAYIGTRAELEASSQALFDVLGSGTVKVSINQRYDLADVADAHRDLEARRTTGTTILLPGG